MSKLIKNWEELAQVPANDKYRLVIDRNMGCGWIVPIGDTPTDECTDDFDCHCSHDTQEYINFFEHHVYLSTHTFYGSTYKKSTELLQSHGFDVEIDNWDKGETNE